MTSKTKRKTRECTVCGRYRAITATGVLKLHPGLDGGTCEGSTLPPKAKATRVQDPTARLPGVDLRRAVFERDGYRCRKCNHHSPTGEDLQPHHVKTFVAGGETTIDNLHTLCSVCHAELSWLWVDEPPVPYEQWLKLAPATLIVRVLLAIRDDYASIGGALAHALGIERDVAIRLLEKPR